VTFTPRKLGRRPQRSEDTIVHADGHSPGRGVTAATAQKHEACHTTQRAFEFYSTLMSMARQVYNSLSVALIGFSSSGSLPLAFFSPPYQPSAPSRSGKMGCEKW